MSEEIKVWPNVTQFGRLNRANNEPNGLLFHDEAHQMRHPGRHMCHIVDHDRPLEQRQTRRKPMHPCGHL